MALDWIDENQRRENPEGLKRKVRSHVRRGIHAKQRRLNAAARPRPPLWEARRIVRKSDRTGARHSIAPGKRTLAQIITTTTPLPVGQRSSVSTTREHFMTPYLSLSNQDAASNNSFISLPRIEASRSVYFPLSEPSSDLSEPALNSTSLTRQQFNNSRFDTAHLHKMIPRQPYLPVTPYALLLGDGAPTLQIEGRNWPFLHPIVGNGPALSVWMPGGAIPIPNAESPRPCLLKSARPIQWISNSSDFFRFKGEVIRWVNRNLANNNLATSETTIGVILCLMSFEVSKFR